MDKFCNRCKTKKDVKDFYTNKSRKDGCQTICKKCQNKVSKKNYEDNKKDYFDRNKRYRKEIKDMITSLKKDKLCADCGLKFNTWQMDFDHISGKKEFNISDIYNFGSKKKVLEEIAKCELVCANCHRNRTHDRMES
jgi:hypothetical protein